VSSSSQHSRCDFLSAANGALGWLIHPGIASVLTLLVLLRQAVPGEDEKLREFRELTVQAEQEYGYVEFRSKWTNYGRSGDVTQLDQMNGLMAGPYCVSEQTFEYPPSRLSGELPGFVQGSNKKYRFSLSRKASDYVLTELTAPPFTLYQNRQCSFAVPLTRDTYHSLLGRPETRVVSRSEVAWRGRPHTEWVLDTTNAESGTKERIGLFVRPDRPGLICGIRWYDPENLAQWLEEFVVEYETDGSPWPAPKAIEEWRADKTKWLNDKSAAYETWRAARTEFSLWRRLPPGPPGEEFTLSHYNLPEPKQVPTTTAHLPGVPRGASQSVPPATTPENGPDSEEPSPLADLVEAAGPWPWLGIGSILVVAASVYIRYRRRTGTSEA
jgi:hypothetical protein